MILCIMLDLNIIYTKKIAVLLELLNPRIWTHPRWIKYIWTVCRLCMTKLGSFYLNWADFDAKSDGMGWVYI